MGYWNIYATFEIFEDLVYWAAFARENIWDCVWWECRGWSYGIGSHFEKYY